jgi:hypothetical protein
MLDPAWTEKALFSFGRDPLGMQAVSVRIYRSLVPGLTNVTNRLRYYSFYCWVVDLWGRREHANDTKRWRAFIRRAEVLYATASLIADPETSGGMAGREWAEEHREAILDSQELDLAAHDDPSAGKTYLKAQAGNFGQFYLASMLDSRMLSPSLGVPLIDQQLGRAIASAFAAAVGDAGECAAEAILDGRIPTGDLESLGRAMSPGSLKPGTEEMELLRGYLGGVDGGHEAGARRSSAWLLLDYIRQAGAEGSEWGFRRAAYHRRLPNGTPYRPAGSTAAVWRAYQANELCHAATAALFNGMMQSQVDKHPAGTNPDALISAYIAGIAAELENVDVPWRTWAGKEGKDWLDREDDLARTVEVCLLDEGKPAPSKTDLAHAIRLLAVLWYRWAGEESDLARLVHGHTGPGGNSISTVLSTLSAAQELPMTAAIVTACRRHIIDSHQEIAVRKLTATGRDTYHFTIEDGILSNGRRRAYDYTSPRLANLGRFIADAGFVKANAITADGLAFLEEYAPD